MYKLYKTNNECFLIRAMEHIFSCGERWNISSFTSWKYLYHCTRKHSLFVYYYFTVRGFCRIVCVFPIMRLLLRGYCTPDQFCDCLTVYALFLKITTHWWQVRYVSYRLHFKEPNYCTGISLTQVVIDLWLKT